MLDTLANRCGDDNEAAVAIASDAGIAQPDVDAWLHPAPPVPVTVLAAPAIDADTSALLAALPPPGPSTEADPVRLLDTITAGIEPTTLEPAP